MRLIGNQVAIIQVTAYKDKTLPLLAQELCIGGYKNAPHDGPAENFGGQWAGPLPQPEDIRN